MVTYIVTNTLNGANLREAASDSSTVLATMRFGETAELIEDTGTKWKRVRHRKNGTVREGFASDVNLTVAKTDAIARLIASAAFYWDLFDRGDGMEGVQPFKNHVLKMWDDLGGGRPPGDNTSHRKWPWSAAGMSAFIRRAGGYDGFKFAAGHSIYIHDSIKQRDNGNENAPFWGFKLSEKKPEAGDLVVQWREIPKTFADARASNEFSSHTDVVCEIKDNILWAIGANVSSPGTVDRKRYGLTGTGHLKAESKVFMLMKNMAR